MSTTHLIMMGIIDGAGTGTSIPNPPTAKKTSMALYLGLRLALSLFAVGVLYHG